MTRLRILYSVEFFSRQITPAWFFRKQKVSVLYFFLFLLCICVSINIGRSVQYAKFYLPKMIWGSIFGMYYIHYVDNYDKSVYIFLLALQNIPVILTKMKPKITIRKIRDILGVC